MITISNNIDFADGSLFPDEITCWQANPLRVELLLPSGQTLDGLTALTLELRTPGVLGASGKLAQIVLVNPSGSSATLTLTGAQLNQPMSAGVSEKRFDLICYCESGLMPHRTLRKWSVNMLADESTSSLTDPPPSITETNLTETRAAQLLAAKADLVGGKVPVDQLPAVASGSGKLDALAALTWAANKMIYLTGPGTAAVAELTAAARTLLTAGNAENQRYALGLPTGTLAMQNSQSLSLAGGAPEFPVLAVTGAAFGANSVGVSAITFAQAMNNLAEACHLLTMSVTSGSAPISGSSILQILSQDNEQFAFNFDGSPRIYTLRRSAWRTQLGLGTVATLAAPAGAIVGTTDTQTLANKTLTSPILDRAAVTASGAASLSAFKMSGSIFSGGSGTTNEPLLMIKEPGSSNTSWNTLGCAIGVNVQGSNIGSYFDAFENGTLKARIGRNGVFAIGVSGAFADTFGSYFSLNPYHGLTMVRGNLLAGQRSGIKWSSGGNPNTGFDTQICSKAPGVVEINSGTNDDYRDLVARNLTASGLITSGSFTVGGTLPAASASMFGGACVINALAPVVGSVVVAGGSAKAAVRSNGTNWIVTEVL